MVEHHYHSADYEEKDSMGSFSLTAAVIQITPKLK
jgi:hypothetical protein